MIRALLLCKYCIVLSMSIILCNSCKLYDLLKSRERILFPELTLERMIVSLNHYAPSSLKISNQKVYSRMCSSLWTQVHCDLRVQESGVQFKNFSYKTIHCYTYSIVVFFLPIVGKITQVKFACSRACVGFVYNKISHSIHKELSNNSWIDLALKYWTDVAAILFRLKKQYSIHT
jgi:hypothetical protein